MSISSFFFQAAYFAIGIGAISYLKNVVGYKHIRKLDEAYQKAIREGREPNGIEAAGHTSLKIMKFSLILIAFGAVFIILGVISESFSPS